MSKPDLESMRRRLGEALKALRKSRGLTENELAERMGKKPSAGTMVSRWERGETTPGSDQLWLYLDGVDASFADLDRQLNPRPATNRRLREIAHELESLSRVPKRTRK